MALLGYARVSTGEQDARGQHDQLEAAGCTRIWTETASGALASRPQLERLLDYAHEGDTIVVTRLDRLGRSLSHLVATVADLGDRGAGFRSLAEELDTTTTAAGRLAFHLFGALAQFGRDLTRERTRAGLEAASARGRVGARPSVMTPQRVETARQMVANGQQVAQVPRTLGVSRATSYRHVSS
jgi:DNA invertase Pin-like site-specific DNA recombinase